MKPAEQRWYEQRARFDWELPPMAPRFYRLPIIRHIRAFLHLALAIDAALLFQERGIGTGEINAYDKWVIEGIRKGWR